MHKFLYKLCLILFACCCLMFCAAMVFFVYAIISGSFDFSFALMFFIIGILMLSVMGSCAYIYSILKKDVRDDSSVEDVDNDSDEDDDCVPVVVVEISEPHVSEQSGGQIVDIVCEDSSGKKYKDIFPVDYNVSVGAELVVHKGRGWDNYYIDFKNFEN